MPAVVEPFTVPARFLYRLSKSDYANQFVLKGARLFTLWSDKVFRPTRDLDLLGFGDSSPEALRGAIQHICQVSVQADGLSFDHMTVAVEDIRAEQEYDGQRVKLVAFLDKARIPLQIDIGFGDAVTPEPVETDYTLLLDTFPAPRIRVYPRESVIAEKLQAMVFLGQLNTRMKDFYDLYTLASEFSFHGPTLRRAIEATFARRKTTIPTSTPLCFQEEFARSDNSRALWAGFLSRLNITDDRYSDFTSIVAMLRTFLEPPLIAAGQNNTDYCKNWCANTGWHPEK
ncbi:MAG: nucleotidyl transferase AbiEii/AbiGii toxin family protein [Candidatus Hydrogenedentes bacterium]|nr:nucleotidyl transferase AbiEii/AbiGii toxin family protein [Candidatus Hydrogenedentota bacterium]